MQPSCRLHSSHPHQIVPFLIPPGYCIPSPIYIDRQQHPLSSTHAVEPTSAIWTLHRCPSPCRRCTLPSHPPEPHARLAPPPLQSVAAGDSLVTDAAQVALDVEAACSAANFPAADCALLARAVSMTPQGNLGKRPAALCARLRQCDLSSTCILPFNSNTTDKRPLDACTANGLVGGASVGSLSE